MKANIVHVNSRKNRSVMLSITSPNKFGNATGMGTMTKDRPEGRPLPPQYQNLFDRGEIFL